MEDFKQFIGMTYSHAADSIKSIASSKGLTIVPWPDGIGMVSDDEDTLVVIINNDMDQIIVRFEQ